MADLDHFKRVNDSYGHETGDAVLRGFTATARGSIRASDWLARAGGEEFVIVLPETTLQGGVAVAEKIRSACESAALPGPAGPIQVTASFGVATLPSARPQDEKEEQQMLREADAALYESKRTGRNRVSTFSGPGL